MKRMDEEAPYKDLNYKNTINKIEALTSVRNVRVQKA